SSNPNTFLKVPISSATDTPTLMIFSDERISPHRAEKVLLLGLQEIHSARRSELHERGQITLAGPEGGPCLGVKADYAFLEEVLHRVLQVRVSRDNVHRALVASDRQLAHLLARDTHNGFGWRCGGGVPTHAPDSKLVPSCEWAEAGISCSSGSDGGYAILAAA